MRLGIVSDCIHIKHPDGRIGTENHILLKQLEALAVYFNGVVLCCPFEKYDEDKVASYYSIPDLSTVPVPNVGGNNFCSKLALVKTIPVWWKAFKKVNKQTGIVYQRFPNNLNIPGFFYFYFKQKKVFATYTGTWDGYENEPATYRLQRWLLRKYFRGPVWVYSDTKINDARIRTGNSPSYSESVWHEETEQVNHRIEKLQQYPAGLLRMITVGAFVPNKNQQLILGACLKLYQAGIPFRLTLVGDGYLKESYRQFIQQHQLNYQIVIAGKKTAEELRVLYREHDFVVQAPLREGFGKVPVEGFFHGLVPVLSNVGMANTLIQQGKRGFVFERGNVESLFQVLKTVLADPQSLIHKIQSGRAFATSQTLEAWAKGYYEGVKNHYQTT